MKKVTTRDIARAAGVSQSTVSFVLRNSNAVSISLATREHVLKIANELGYQLKKVIKKNPLIILLVPTLSNLYYPHLIQNIEFYTKSKDISVIVLNTLRGENLELLSKNSALMNQADGILCLFTPNVNLIETALPSVIVGEQNPSLAIDTISLNSFQASTLLTEHLVERGHKRIAYISTPLDKISLARQNRFEGICEVLSRNNLEKYLDVIIWDDEIETENIAFEYVCGQKMAEKLLDTNKDISAIIAVNDMTAAGVISTLNNRNISIPGQIAVAGFDNLLISEMLHPTLTTVDQMALYASKLGLDILLEKIEGVQKESRIIKAAFEPNLIVRAST